MLKPKTLNTNVARNGEVKLLLEGILKWSTMCENFTKLFQEWLKKEHETEFETLDEMTNRSRKWNHNVEAHLLHVKIITNR
jgi:hypothetical protein